MLNRRQFLATAAVVPPSLFPGPTLAQTPEQHIVDTHIHLYDPGRPQGVPWPPKNEAVLYKTHLPAEFRQATKGLGITGAIVVEASPWLEDNQWVLDLAKQEPLILGVVGHLQPGTPEFAGTLERFGANDMFRG